VLDGNMLKDGYLFKRVALNSLIYWGVEPTDSERVKFSPPSRDGREVDPDEWVSDLYDRRGKKKKSRASTSADLKASTSELMDDCAFGIHDLVLFGSVTAFLSYLIHIALFCVYQSFFICFLFLLIELERRILGSSWV
jgi:hypothetical protein